MTNPLSLGDPDHSTLTIRVHNREPLLTLRNTFNRQPGQEIPRITHVLTIEEMQDMHEWLTLHLMSINAMRPSKV
jgi:hypothetical protein